MWKCHYPSRAHLRFGAGLKMDGFFVAGRFEPGTGKRFLKPLHCLKKPQNGRLYLPGS
jgi:hypothetical protein